jgi:hypothetical protein
MKISAVIWSKDEAEVLARSVGQLLRSGVQSISIMDDNSKDGTRLVIDTLCATFDNVRQLPLVDDLTDALKMDGPVFGPVIARDAPDWLLVTDPDEFWIPRSGSLLGTRALQSHDVIQVERFNAALPPGPVDPNRVSTQDALIKLPLLTQRRNLSMAAMAADPSLRWISHQVNPKLIVRPDKITGFGLGMHDVVPAGDEPLKRARGQDIVIAHLPFTSFARFERKVQNIAGVFARFNAEHSGNIAWHWRRWLDLYQRGQLRAEFDRQFLDPEAWAALEAAGGLADANGIFAQRRAEAAARQSKSAAG